MAMTGKQSGKKGIRTLGTRESTTVFETAPIDHSGIFPFLNLLQNYAIFRENSVNRILK